jgi:hypothetical protein
MPFSVSNANKLNPSNDMTPAKICLDYVYYTCMREVADSIGH